VVHGREHLLLLLSHEYARLLVLRVHLRARRALGRRLSYVRELLHERVHRVVAALHHHLLRALLLPLRLRSVRAHRREELGVMPLRRLLAAFLLARLERLALGLGLGREGAGRRPACSLPGRAAAALHRVHVRRGP